MAIHIPDDDQEEDRKLSKHSNGNSKNGIHISGVQGDVFGIATSGSHNIIGKNIGQISLSNEQFIGVSNEFALSLKAFAEKINEQLITYGVTEEQTRPISKSIDALAEEIKDIKPEKGITYRRRTKIEDRLGDVIDKLLDALPEAADTISTFTPLAPFHKLIGKGVESLVEAYYEKQG